MFGLLLEYLGCHVNLPLGVLFGSHKACKPGSAMPPVAETAQTRACPASPTELDKGGSNWSRQSTTEVVDEDGRRFSRQTTEDPSYSVSRQTTAFSRQTTEEPSYTQQGNFSRQTTEEPRRQLPLSQLLSLPEPGETETSSPHQSRAVSRAGSSEPEARERSEELKVRLKNTFLHFEPAQTSADSSTKVNKRPSSLPPSFNRSDKTEEASEN